MKAGGGYVPLDPAFPAERLTYIAENSGVEIIIKNCDWSAEIVTETIKQVIDLNTDADAWKDSSEENLETTIIGDQLAYVIYTSGSTGQPKGVGIRHQSLLALLEWADQEYPADVLTGTLAATSSNFDLSAYEMFLPLIKGGRVLITKNLLESDHFRDQITLINTVPSVMSEFMKFAEFPPHVRVVNLAGEALPRELVTALYQKDVEQVWNLYRAVRGYDLLDGGTDDF